MRGRSPVAMTAPDPSLQDRPLVVTMGDAVGIGPEIIVKAAVAGQLHDAVIVGDPLVLARAQQVVGAAPMPLTQSSSLEQAWRSLAGHRGHGLHIWAPAGMPQGLSALPWGQVHSDCGLAASLCVTAAAQAAREGAARAVVTAPLHKEALAQAGVRYPGHTEMLQSLCAQGNAVPAVRMMLASDELKVVLVTIHLALRHAIECVTFDSVLETLRITHQSCRAWLPGQRPPRIAVAGLNPHAGEGGLFGREEIEHIAPAVAAAQLEGIDVHGPLPADTVFMRARHSADHAGEFDVVVAMTHDQGLIPVKYLGLDQGVNITLGLPLVRTSPDHGTAFDMAGQGRAHPGSLIAALQWARRLALTRPLE